MSGNERGSSNWEESPSFIRSNNDQGWRSKEVSPKVGKPKEHHKGKRPKSCSKSSNDRSTDEERSPSPQRRLKSWRSDIDLEAIKTKRKSIGDIHLRHHHQAHLMTILMRVNIEITKARKAQIPDLGRFLRRISTNTACLQMWPNTPTLIMILTSKRQT